MFRVIAIFCLCICGLDAGSTTHKPRPSHEPSEHEIFTFIYEPNTHKFVISVGLNCYIFPLTIDERLAVHTDVGIKALELKLAGMIDTANKTAVTKENINSRVAHACSRKATNYFQMSN